MENEHEHKPLYRFFNVILFILYSIAVLATLLAVYVGYNERDVVSASVKCKDGTSWDAKEIGYNEYKLCGICTNRSTDNKNYEDCATGSLDTSSYTVSRKYNFSWNTLVYPLIVFAITFGIIDFLRLAILYIFSGRVAFEKSLLLRTILLFFSGNDK